MPVPPVWPCASAAEVAEWSRRDADTDIEEFSAAEDAGDEQAAGDAFCEADLSEPIPDFDDDPGDGVDAWETGLAAEWAASGADNDDLPPSLRGCFPAGLCPREDGQGAGFAASGVADRLAPGVVLAGLTGDLWDTGLGRVNDDELIGVLRAWHRLISWATAGELAAVAELERRRNAEVAAGADPHLAEHVGDELAVSLTLTGRSAGDLLDFAVGLARLPLTAAALASGEIDRGRAWVIVDELGCLGLAHAQLVEAQVIGRAGHKTSGQLRAAVRRAVLAVDASAAKRRCEKARQQARVEVWDEGTGGTAGLAGRDLPPAEALAADKRINALARHLRTGGMEGTLDQLRARVYLALLLGQPIDPSPSASRNPDSHPTGAESPSTSPGLGDASPADGLGDASPADGLGDFSQSHDERTVRTDVNDAASREPCAEIAQGGARSDPAELGGGGPGAPVGGAAASVNLTMPLRTWLGTSSEPGEVAGFGSIPAEDARALARLSEAPAGARWCLTFTDRSGRAVAHGCAIRRARLGRSASANGPPGDWELAITIRPIATGGCLHLGETLNYRPSSSLYHIVNTRQRTCGFPGCRRQATKCDADHTIPYHLGGRTCECNLAPLCRRHHRAKQTKGWRLEQPEPGILEWWLPHGRTYRIEPGSYPREATPGASQYGPAAAEEKPCIERG